MRSDAEQHASLTAAELEDLYQSGVYAKRPLTIVRGQGARVFNEAGREYIDCVAGISVANLGHCHPRVVQAISEQAGRLIVCQEGFSNDRRAELYRRLVAVAPGSLERVFFCSSGAEAIEGAIKFARLATGRTEVVAAMRGFHGRTLGALSATFERSYREPFQPLVPGFTHVPFNDLDRLDAALGARTAAVILEPVQGEGGVRPGLPEFLLGAQALCRERGALLILDEIQTAYGRTGRLFAAEHHGLDPDLLCLAKSMAGGLPMGAVLIGPRVGALPKRVHGATFGGNPLACAAALATLDVLRDEDLAGRAAKLGTRALAALRAIPSPLIREVRGLGLMLGVELRIRAAPLLAALQERGVLALLSGNNVLRLLPPLVIEEEDLDRVIAAVGEVLLEQSGESA